MINGQTSKATRQSIIQCLRTYALVDQTHNAEKIIREEFIRPFLDKTITRQAVEPLRPSSSATPEQQPLVIMYNKILSFASNDLRLILDIAQRTLKNTNYEILVNSLWVQIVDHINKKCSSIYAAGQTEACHKVSVTYFFHHSCAHASFLVARTIHHRSSSSLVWRTCLTAKNLYYTSEITPAMPNS